MLHIMRSLMLKTTLRLVLFYIFPALSFSVILRERFPPRNFTPGKEINFCKVNLDNKISRFTNLFGKGIRQNVPKRNLYTIKFGLERTDGVETACWEFQNECNDNNAKTPPIIKLLDYINGRYLGGCITVIKYDDYYKYNEEWILDYFLRQEQSPHIHGPVEKKTKKSAKALSVSFKGRDCRNYIFLISDVLRARGRIGWHVGSKVVIITRSSKEDIHDFLRHFTSSAVRNLLIVANSKNESSSQRYPDINMYTHQLFADSNGSSIPQILTAWRCSTLTRPHVSLFPPKMRGGLNGYSVKVVLGHQPPFVFPKLSKINPDLIDKCNYTATPDEWDGREVRLLRLLSTALNFTLIFREAHVSGVGKEVASKMVQQLISGKVNVAAGGIHLTPSRLRTINMDMPHSQDCITFVTKASVAMPRYRAIMGPFHWKVWVAVTLIYLLAMFPLAFSHRHTLSDLLTNPWEIENMFWYVFGTFTNCFTFKSKSSWSQADKSATKMLIGWYWVFSIIITACYTGSIIAFVTLPVYPAFVDTSQEVLDRRFRIGTLEGGGYDKLLNNSADPVITALLENLEFVPRVSDGILNITKAFYRPYAYLGSRTLLDFILKANYTSSSEGARDRFHLADECVVPFHLALAFPVNATYAYALNHGTLLVLESGLFSKIKKDVKWENDRTSRGKLIQAAVASSVKSITDRRKLSLDDVQGTFLLLGAGFAIGFFTLFLECVNWMWNTKSCWCCKRTPAPTKENSFANHN